MNSVTLVRRIAARPAIVFDAFATTEGLTSWWGPDDFPVISASADVRVGGLFCVRFGTADGREHECSGEFLEVVKPERLAMSWRWSDGGEAEECGAVSRVELHLRAIDTDLASACHVLGPAGSGLRLGRRPPRLARIVFSQ
jgi:uncharacterized protein YndB with AHSA1/START domain